MRIEVEYCMIQHGSDKKKRTIKINGTATGITNRFRVSWVYNKDSGGPGSLSFPTKTVDKSLSQEMKKELALLIYREISKSIGTSLQDMVTETKEFFIEKVVTHNANYIS